MASRSVSPGGALLRASRVFSIPSPLPRPATELSSSSVFTSETATLPHPTHLSITTPQSSLNRGDWGFKRPLPLRSTTKSSTPLIRVDAIDTFEHITEFGSSADHTLTLLKWQEMDVPLSTPTLRENQSAAQPKQLSKSVFEDELDTTTPTEKDGFRKEDTRWKFKGPWLAGQTEGDFNQYLMKEVRSRKDEFSKFLREKCAATLTSKKRLDGDYAEPLKASDITENQLTDYVKELREEMTELYSLIRNFLDLPPAPSKNSRLGDEHGVNSLLSNLNELGYREQTYQRDTELSVSMSPYAENGPPKTHPSAGLAYSRTNRHIFNHPEFGPQKQKPPVQARVILPKKARGGNAGVIVGVGGFAAALPNSGAYDMRGSTNRFKGGSQIPLVEGLLKIEPHKEGGSKIYVHPMSATVDTKGKIILKVAAPDEEAVAVKEGTTASIPQAPISAPKFTPPEKILSFHSGKSVADRGGYGLTLEGNKRPGPLPRG